MLGNGLISGHRMAVGSLDVLLSDEASLILRYLQSMLELLLELRLTLKEDLCLKCVEAARHHLLDIWPVEVDLFQPLIGCPLLSLHLSIEERSRGLKSVGRQIILQSRHAFEQSNA